MNITLKSAYDAGYRLGLQYAYRGFAFRNRDEEMAAEIDSDPDNIPYNYDGPYIEEPPTCPICGQPMRVSIQRYTRMVQVGDEKVPKKYKADKVFMDCQNRSCPAFQDPTAFGDDIEKPNSQYWQQIQQIMKNGNIYRYANFQEWKDAQRSYFRP